jgi:hypothetical protein
MLSALLQISRVGSAPHTVIAATDYDTVCALCGAHLKHTVVLKSTDNGRVAG